MGLGQQPTAAQAEALDAWACGRNVAVQAVPGAGKSWLLIEACRTQPLGDAVIVVYNSELEADVSTLAREAGLAPRVRCFTFHALFSQCATLTPDDYSLEQALLAVRRGALAARPIRVASVLLDESQDVNRLHVEVIRACVAMDEDTQVGVVGDSHQELYDYGEFPALGRFLRRPEEFFASRREWHHVALRTSHRLTPPMASLLSVHFGTSVTSSKTGGAPVAVHMCGEFKMGDVVGRIVAEHGHVPLSRISVLAATKTFNAPLRAALNALSARGVSLYVHGVDLAHERVREHKLRVSSWHSSKGTECVVNIVLLPAKSKSNPLYVALSRGNAHLHLVFATGRVDGGLLSTLARLPAGMVEARDGAARSALQVAAGESPDEPAAGDEPAASGVPARPKSLDIWRVNTNVLKGARVRSEVAARRAPVATTVVSTSTGSEDVAGIYEMALRIRLEAHRTGRVRFVDDLLSPCRMAPEDQPRAIGAGHQGRFVGVRITEANLLPPELRDMAAATYRQPEKSNADWALLACACLAWNAYHHTMRQAIPVTWVDDALFSSAWERTLAFFDDASRGDAALFDVRLFRAAPSLVHVRCHVATAACAYHLVWSELSASHRADACLRAVLHPSGRCRLFSMTAGTVEMIEACDRDDIVSLLV